MLGATPYVEDGEERTKRCVEWAVRTAVERRLHLDFHLDYHLEGGKEAVVWNVLEVLRREEWGKRMEGKTVCLGHCSRLTLFRGEEWERLRKEVKGLPVYFVGLPTSDLFMMGRPGKGEGEGEEARDNRPRGTMQVLDMIGMGLKCALGINNVGNAFTPWGNTDPLSVACLGVGFYQAGTAKQARTLYGCVSWRAKEAIGFGSHKVTVAEDSNNGEADASEVNVGDPANFVMFGGLEGQKTTLLRRPRKTVQEIVWDPTGVERVTIFRGRRVELE